LKPLATATSLVGLHPGQNLINGLHCKGDQKMSFRNIVAGAVVAFGMALGGGAVSAAVIDLGFALDKSGSVGSANYNTTKEALATALGLIPTTGDNQYRVSVVSFGSSVTVDLAPTIVTADTISAIQNAVRNSSYSGGGTRTDLAISSLTNAFVNADGGLGDLTLFNISTDGSPSSQANTLTAANAARTAGVDGISFEAIGSFSQTQLNNMAALASPGTPVIVHDLDQIPNPTEHGFVIAVTGFDAYQAAINAKVERIIEDTGGGTTPIPLPASLPLLLAGLGLVGGLRLRRKHAA